MGLWKDSRAAFAVSKRPAQYGQSIYVSVMLALMAFAAGAHPAFAVVRASIVVDAQTGSVLLAHNADAHAHPASLTKLMTLYLTFERLQKGSLSLNQELRISRHAAAQQPAKLWLRPGSHITVRAAILGIVTKSANDAAVVLAEGIAGSESRFARLMNIQARELGMTRTSFYNASGLPNRRQWTTARDMSRLALALLHDYPDYYHFFGVRSFVFRGHTVYGHDHLLDNYPGTDGLKTGYIRASGYNLVTSAVHDDRRLVGVVLGGSTAWRRDRQMMALLNRGFARAGADVETAQEDVPAATRRHTAHVRLASADLGEENLRDPDGRDWIVQIGGNFHSAHSVRRVLHSALLSAPSSLRPGRQLVVKLHGQRYRARFSHLSRQMAMSACRRLQRKGYTCRILNFHPSESDLAATSTPSKTQAD